ncbi:hypothetical protein GCK72_009540 [Caenorhabditis remanei]|uniref:Snake toxin/toxin-like domain-containing protein n=1 Tax=Caenorhabditis remanei TaxID=31234 RepID=A0A6A5H2U6_CAERE|nr:hypothetical protein GCK72_009540 [Caenorhabditis remanei]KAF1761285.1 hypothetical protein GCK72_009540 [Caenorhabditis remanei]
MYDPEHRDAWCANESLVQFEPDETAKICAPWEKFCVTAVNTINKAFTSVSRGCGERCSELCESIGYGQDQVNCDDCCEEDLCNSNFSIQYYEVLMSRQYTSWTTPLPGEVIYESMKLTGYRWKISVTCIQRPEVSMCQVSGGEECGVLKNHNNAVTNSASDTIFISNFSEQGANIFLRSTLLSWSKIDRMSEDSFDHVDPQEQSSNNYGMWLACKASGDPLTMIRPSEKQLDSRNDCFLRT